MRKRHALLSTVAIILWAGNSLFARVPVVLSTDVGNEIDDQWAITYLLANPEFDVKGLLSAHGPTLPNPSAHYTYQLLTDVVERRLGQLAHVPILEGSSLPLANETTPRISRASEYIVTASREFSASNRLVVLNIGAATDLASALLQDPSLANRITVVAMAFTNSQHGDEFNVQNDPLSWNVIFRSQAPVVIGSGDICRRDLAMSFEHAKSLLAGLGSIGSWLWDEYQVWYFRVVKPLRTEDYSKPWIIWDNIALAYALGMTTQQELPRRTLDNQLNFSSPSLAGKISWITKVDSERMWRDFEAKIKNYQSTHAVGLSHCLFEQ